jgi:class II lanthipeptide synthase
MKSTPKEIGQLIIEKKLHLIMKLSSQEISEKNGKRSYNSRLEDIDIGVCGIVLFLIELYKGYPDLRLKKAIQNAGEDLISHCNNNPRLHFGFYKGRSGVCYTLLEISEALQDDIYLGSAMDIMQNGSNSFLQSEFVSNRLYDGRAGLLLVLVKLFNSTHTDWLLEEIKHCIDRIIGDFVIANDGLVYQRKDNNIMPLNSFLNGSSGIAHILMQVGKYFNDSELISMAKYLMNFEDNQWDEKLFNWPDFRHAILSGTDFQIHKSKYIEKDISFFTSPKESFSWAFGTTGICLSRLSVVEEENYQRESLYEKGLQKAIEYRTDDSSLANGISGLGTLCIESLKYKNRSFISRRLSEIKEHLISSKFSFNDNSLFHGITGIGYFLLQLEKPADFHSILRPQIINGSDSERIEIPKKSKSEYTFKTFQNTFPYTSVILQTIAPKQKLYHFFEFNSVQLNNMFLHLEDFISSIKSHIPEKHFLVILDALSLDKSMIQFFSEQISYSLNHIKELVKFEEKIALLNMDEKELSDQLLVFDQTVKICITKWDWTRLKHNGVDVPKTIHEFISIEPEKTHILLALNKSNDVDAEKLDTFGKLTYSIFRQPINARAAINKYLDAFDIKSEDQKAQIKSYAIRYISLYIKKSLLNRLG